MHEVAQRPSERLTSKKNKGLLLSLGWLEWNLEHRHRLE